MDLKRPAALKVRSGVLFGNYWQDNFEPTWSCPLEERIQQRDPLSTIGQSSVGYSYGDGGKWVCDPYLLKERKCLVYSFGSNGDFAFEHGLDQRVDGACEIHIFDPFNTEGGSNVVNNAVAKVKLAERKMKVHSYGLAAYDYTTPPLSKWKGMVANFKSLQTIARELNHTQRVIDVLKIDIDGGEYGLLDNSTWWDSFDSSTAGLRIGQLLLELHFNAISPTTFRFRDEHNNWVRARTGQEVDGVMRMLYKRGFVLFHKEVNLIGKPPNDAAEFALIRLGIPCTTPPSD